jgi:hypothetical protein
MHFPKKSTKSAPLTPNPRGEGEVERKQMIKKGGNMFLEDITFKQMLPALQEKVEVCSISLQQSDSSYLRQTASKTRAYSI